MEKDEIKHNKKMLFYENLIVSIGVFITFALLIVTSYFETNEILYNVLIYIAIIILVVVATISIRIEQKAGYYECQKCQNRYVPTYFKTLLAPHFNRTRYMKCPDCNQRSWQKKVLGKEKEDE